MAGTYRSGLALSSTSASPARRWPSERSERIVPQALSDEMRHELRRPRLQLGTAASAEDCGDPCGFEGTAVGTPRSEVRQHRQHPHQLQQSCRMAREVRAEVAATRCRGA